MFPPVFTVVNKNKFPFDSRYIFPTGTRAVARVPASCLVNDGKKKNTKFQFSRAVQIVLSGSVTHDCQLFTRGDIFIA